MKRYIHASTGRVAWAMQIRDATFLPDAARPESEGLVYDAKTKLATVLSPEDGGAQSTGGVGDWVVEVAPGEFEIMTDDAFGQAYQLQRSAS